MSTDAEWEELGKNDPYYGVITHEKFRSQNLTAEAKCEFFESGRGDVSHVLEVCRHYLDQGFMPKKILDFGCGTGRLVIPFAKVAERVVGLDVSDSMLNEARKNCAEHSADNVVLMKSDDDLSCLNERFDFIHSYIVFQHIPVERGRRIFTNLLEHLEAGGICAVQFSYSKDIYRDSHGVPPAEYPARKLLRKIKGFVKKKELMDPEIQMNPYNLNELFFLVQSSGVHRFHVEFTNHGGELGVFLFFQKPQLA